MTRDFDAELAELRRRYIAALPEKLARLGIALHAAREGGTPNEALLLAHRLAATARLHGLAQLAARAASLADSLAALGDTATAMQWNELRRLHSGALDEVTHAA